MTITISSLYTYPIKSCGGLSHDRVELTATGPAYDRHWVLTEPDGTAITQREFPKMSLIQPRFADGSLFVSAPGAGEMCVPLARRDGLRRAPVNIWRDTVEAVDEGDEAAAWFSDFLGLAVRLFHMPPSTFREVDPAYTEEPAQVGFVDGYPLLVISDASLADLNERLAERGHPSLTMHSFRPNIVMAGVEAPFAEDDWTRFTVGEVAFDVVKACARCSITTVDPATGEIPNRKEPLATLATFRQGVSGVLFGQNTIHRATGTLAVGDAVTVS